MFVVLRAEKVSRVGAVRMEVLSRRCQYCIIYGGPLPDFISQPRRIRHPQATVQVEMKLLYREG